MTYHSSILISMGHVRSFLSATAMHVHEWLCQCPTFERELQPEQSESSSTQEEGSIHTQNFWNVPSFTFVTRRELNCKSPVLIRAKTESQILHQGSKCTHLSIHSCSQFHWSILCDCFQSAMISQLDMWPHIPLQSKILLIHDCVKGVFDINVLQQTKAQWWHQKSKWQAQKMTNENRNRLESIRLQKWISHNLNERETSNANVQSKWFGHTQWASKLCEKIPPTHQVQWKVSWSKTRRDFQPRQR